MLLRFIIFAAAAFIIYKLFIGDQKKKQQDQAKQQEKMAADGIMVKDPVCGTYVSAQNPIRVKSGSQVHCFCSYECRDQYLTRLEEKNHTDET